MGPHVRLVILLPLDLLEEFATRARAGSPADEFVVRVESRPLHAELPMPAAEGPKGGRR